MTALATLSRVDQLPLTAFQTLLPAIRRPRGRGYGGAATRAVYWRFRAVDFPDVAASALKIRRTFANLTGLCIKGLS
ncbi:MAG: hypothetical protein KDK00_07985 [Rhodobacteraceae bacterium]|nr:hypothetical protein [Paracoccaceae bacterium]